MTPKAETNAEIQSISIKNGDGAESTVMAAGSLRQLSINWKTAPANKGYATDWYFKTSPKSKATKISNDGVLSVGSDEPDGYLTIGVNVDTKGLAGTKPVNKETQVQIQNKK